MKAAVVTLGCAKNQCCSEQMLWSLREAGYELTGDVAESDLNVVNTCAFTESARAESIDRVVELCALRGKVVVTGCLAQMYKDEIYRELPEVAGLVGCGSFADIAQAARGALAGQRPALFAPLGAPEREIPRITRGPAAYLKIAEGCSHRCAYCRIPSLRGDFTPRPPGDILREAATLADMGVSELIVIAQDITAHPGLLPLLRQMVAIEGLRRVRLHYLHPGGITDELLRLVASEEKIVKYLDVPVQHCNAQILAAMGRACAETPDALFARIKAAVPGVALRTTVITGFPQETEARHEELCAFLARHRLPRAGIFMYSREEGTAAAAMSGQVTQKEKRRRYRQLLAVQNAVLAEYHASMRGNVVEVLCESEPDGRGLQTGRSYAESPDVDGVIRFSSRKPVCVGDYAYVMITGETRAGLLGEVAARQKRGKGE
ncbi:MAG: 30S ribosomal protein S12 methylthiotransferase RimO [Oscillospiraceae bacterium]|jgi:ribosomal protein S12 methylthiotransferase|nr:30S ribosomal protein S12 methylthiotransferase RimO [Oscillospiraceae bacterium]